jgi:hypothetical protein
MQGRANNIATHGRSTGAQVHEIPSQKVYDKVNLDFFFEIL